jgi:hypothetical protein
MSKTTLVKIRISKKDTGLPAVGYCVELAEIDTDNEFELRTDSNGEIKPFTMDMNNYIYLDIFVTDENGDMVVEADKQYKLIQPETIIDIKV